MQVSWNSMQPYDPSKITYRYAWKSDSARLDMPVVAVTVGPEPDKAENYGKALEAVGLRVKYLDFQQEPHLCDVDGLVLTGGGDIDPQLQGVEQPSPTVVGVTRQRDLFERAVFMTAWKQDLPVLGICRGMQVMNWSLGGTLYQDIDAELGGSRGHRQIDRGLAKSDVGQPITMAPGSEVWNMFGTSQVGVNHDHHQAVKEIAPALKATAWAPDGVVEAVEAPEKDFVVGVQFHPELMWQQDAKYLAPFKAFAERLMELRNKAG